MRVTILTDASFCPDTGAGGYGYWIASERGKIGGGKEFKSILDNSVVAEMRAVVNSLFIAAGHKLVQRNDYVLIQTDCMAAIDAFTGVRGCSNIQERATLKEFFKVRDSIGVSVSFKHVKGHTRIKQARYISNNMCDMRAKESMQSARARIRRGE